MAAHQTCRRTVQGSSWAGPWTRKRRRRQCYGRQGRRVPCKLATSQPQGQWVRYKAVAGMHCCKQKVQEGEGGAHLYSPMGSPTSNLQQTQDKLRTYFSQLAFQDQTWNRCCVERGLPRPVQPEGGGGNEDSQAGTNELGGKHGPGVGQGLQNKQSKLSTGLSAAAC